MESLHGKRLVIVGCGYVGTAVAREACRAGLKVEALTRNPARAAELAALGAHPVVADLATDTWHGRLAPGADLVLNCVSSGGGGLDGYRRSYVEGMRSLLTWARRGPAGTIVYTSSTSVYPQDGGVMVDETAPTDRRGRNRADPARSRGPVAPGKPARAAAGSSCGSPASTVRSAIICSIRCGREPRKFPEAAPIISISRIVTISARRSWRHSPRPRRRPAASSMWPMMHPRRKPRWCDGWRSSSAGRRRVSPVARPARAAASRRLRTGLSATPDSRRSWAGGRSTPRFGRVMRRY